MAMTAGDNTVAAGTMSKKLYDEMNSEFGLVSGGDDTYRKNLCAVFAKAFIGYIKDNADVIVTTSDAGLQRNPEDSEDTLAPSSNKTLAGAVD